MLNYLAQVIMAYHMILVFLCENLDLDIRNWIRNP